jgi:hypothetical protein
LIVVIAPVTVALGVPLVVAAPGTWTPPVAPVRVPVGVAVVWVGLAVVRVGLGLVRVPVGAPGTTPPPGEAELVVPTQVAPVTDPVPVGTGTPGITPGPLVRVPPGGRTGPVPAVVGSAAVAVVVWPEAILAAVKMAATAAAGTMSATARPRLRRPRDGCSGIVIPPPCC